MESELLKKMVLLISNISIVARRKRVKMLHWRYIEDWNHHQQLLTTQIRIGLLLNKRPMNCKLFNIPVQQSNSIWSLSICRRLNVTPAIFRAATDSSDWYLLIIQSIKCIFPFCFDYFKLHIPALGFSLLINTLPRLHEHNEYVNADIYLNGIRIYEKIIETIGNIEEWIEWWAVGVNSFIKHYVIDI